MRMGAGRSRKEGLLGPKAIIRGDGYVRHLDGGDGFMGVHTCPNPSNCTL